MMRSLARGYLIRRMLEGNRGRRGYGGGYYPMARRRSSGGFFGPGYGRSRRSSGFFVPQRRSNVRVYGCCLPGCGVMALVPTAAAGMAGRYALRRRRGR